MKHIVASIPGFEFVDVLGRGAQGIVCKVLETKTDRTVALKFTRHGLLATPRDRERFDREIKYQAQFEHPHIARILSAGVTEEGYAWFTTPYIEGLPLDQWLEQTDSVLTLDGRWNLDVFCKICDAVHYLHEMGVVHRDLKPTNVLVDHDDSPMVIDFGLAKALEQSNIDTLTGEGMMVGTPQYASPEQLTAGSVDRRTDIYALGVLLYEWVVGRLPYDCDTEDRSAVISAITKAKVIRPDVVSPGIEPDLQTIILTCLESDPQLRYASAQALARDVERYQQRLVVHAPRPSAFLRLRNTARKHRLHQAAVLCLLTATVAWLSTPLVNSAFFAAEETAPFTVIPMEESKRQTFGTASLASLDGSVELLAEILRVKDMRSDLIEHELLAATQPGVLGYKEVERFRKAISDKAAAAIRTGDIDQGVGFVKLLAKIARDFAKLSDAMSCNFSIRYWMEHDQVIDKLLRDTDDQPIPTLRESLELMGDEYTSMVPVLKKIKRDMHSLVDVAVTDGVISEDTWQKYYSYHPHLFPLFMTWPSQEEAHKFIDDFFDEWIARSAAYEQFDREPYKVHPTYYLVYWPLPGGEKEMREARTKILDNRKKQLQELKRREAAASSN
ncbi:MAG: serine/threonine protein kinase [Phycisphaerae bacterium]